MDDKRTVKLTGLPVSEEMEDILKRLANKESVSIDEINNTSEMKMARSNIAHETPTIERANREDLQEKIQNDLLKLGSATIDDEGKVRYNGSVARESRLDIIIGLPASGKSSAIVDKLSQEFKSRVIDNDEAKTRIPQFNNGWGAGVVHEESQKISDEVFISAISNHENIILPKVGSNANKLIDRYIIDAKENGYSVNIHYVELDRNISMGRMINRFIDDGRFLDPNLIEKYAPANGNNYIDQTYEHLKNSSLIDGYSKWDNDVPRGENPYLLEAKGLDGDYIKNARIKGGNEYGRNQTVSSDIRTNGENGVGRSRRSGLQEKSQGILSEFDKSRTDEVCESVLQSKESGGIGRIDEKDTTRNYGNDGLEEINVANVYGRNEFSEYIKKQEKNIIAVNIEKANDFLQARELHLSEDEDIIRFVNSVSYTIQNVKYPDVGENQKIKEIGRGVCRKIHE